MTLWELMRLFFVAPAAWKTYLGLRGDGWVFASEPMDFGSVWGVAIARASGGHMQRYAVRVPPVADRVDAFARAIPTLAKWAATA